MAEVPPLGRWRQEVQEFKAILRYLANLELDYVETPLQEANQDVVHILSDSSTAMLADKCSSGHAL